MDYLALNDVVLDNKRVLVRVDFNSPMGPNSNILDDKRIKSHLDTLKALEDCRVVLMAHQSRAGKKDFTTMEAHAKLASKCRKFLAKPNTQDTIDDWSDALHMSRRAFTRLFREETGMSLSAWRQQAIVVVALSRLLSGESVTAVAIDYGYSNAGAFSSMFRRITGTTPTDYLARNEGVARNLSKTPTSAHTPRRPAM